MAAPRQTAQSILDALLIFGAFLLAWSVLLVLGDDPIASFPAVLLNTGLMTVGYYLGVQLQDSYTPTGSIWTVTIEHACIGLGVTLLVQAVLVYVGGLLVTPLPVSILGCVLAALFVTLGRTQVLARSKRASTLIVGFDPVVEALLAGAGNEIIGILAETAPSITAAGDVQWLGTPQNLMQEVDQWRPKRIIIGGEQGISSFVSSNDVVKLKISGIEIEESASAYERLFHRVCSMRLRPVDFLFSSSLTANRPMLAMQAIYMNIGGLVLLVLALPLMAVLAALIAVFGGPGPVLKQVSCMGFQQVPFDQLSFRTRRINGTGRTWIGAVIERLGLAGLPQLINVVRGEMAPIGPRVVRVQFAQRLSELMPFYSHRFSVKPGVLGWAQIHLRRQNTGPTEPLTTEYDLFYLKQASPSFELEILLRTLIGR